MTPQEYIDHVIEFANYKRYEYPFYPLALLVEESEELLTGLEEGKSRELILYECGDILWAFVAFCLEEGSPVEFDAWTRIPKLPPWNPSVLQCAVALHRFSSRLIGLLHKDMRGDPDINLWTNQHVHVVSELRSGIRRPP